MSYSDHTVFPTASAPADQTEFESSQPFLIPDQRDRIRIKHKNDASVQTRIRSYFISSDGPKKSLRERFDALVQVVIYKDLGIKLILISQLFNSMMSATAKMLTAVTTPRFHPLQILFIRMSITYTICFLYMYYKKIPDFVLGPKGIRFLLAIRGFTGFFGVFGLYYSLQYLSISDAVTITFLAPTVTGIFAWIFLGEIFTKLEALGGLVSLGGVIMIARPQFLLNLIHHDTVADAVRSEINVTPFEHLKGVLVGLLGVFGVASAFVSIRSIGTRAYPLVTVSYFSACTCFISFFGLLLIPGLGFVLPHGLTQWSLLILLGLCGFLMQFCLTAGLQRVRAARGSSITYTVLIWALLWEKIFFDKVPDAWSWLGSAVIIGSALVVNYYKPVPNEINLDADTRGSIEIDDLESNHSFDIGHEFDDDDDDDSNSFNYNEADDFEFDEDAVSLDGYHLQK